jgi:hypothetical protein
MSVFWQALAERRARAVEVREDYEIVPLDLQAFVVQHPDEPERCYLVDLLKRRCTCPDWACTAQGMSIDCKHLIAVAPVSAFTHNRPEDVESRNQLAEVYRQMAEMEKRDPFAD